MKTLCDQIMNTIVNDLGEFLVFLVGFQSLVFRVDVSKVVSSYLYLMF